MALAMYWHADDGRPQPHVNVTTTIGTAGTSNETWLWIGFSESTEALEVWVRRMNAEALGNATRPIFGLLWEVE